MSKYVLSAFVSYYPVYRGWQNGCEGQNNHGVASHSLGPQGLFFKHQMEIVIVVKNVFFFNETKKKQKQVASSKTQNLKMDYLKKKVEQK